jgi:hypothetical protein
MIDFTVDEMRLAVLALQRMRKEIDVDTNDRNRPVNEGQAQACRYTLAHLDNLTGKLGAKIKEALDGTGADS